MTVYPPSGTTAWPIMNAEDRLTSHSTTELKGFAKVALANHLVNFGVNLDHDAADRVASAWRQQTSVS